QEAAGAPEPPRDVIWRLFQVIQHRCLHNTPYLRSSTAEPRSSNWQARRDSNPQLPVLETGALPIELLAYEPLLALFVSRMFPAEPAELAHLETLGRLLLVLRRAVVAPLTLRAGERDDVSHGCYS